MSQKDHRSEEHTLVPVSSNLYNQGSSASVHDHQPFCQGLETEHQFDLYGSDKYQCDAQSFSLLHGNRSGDTNLRTRTHNLQDGVRLVQKGEEAFAGYNHHGSSQLMDMRKSHYPDLEMYSNRDPEWRGYDCVYITDLYHFPSLAPRVSSFNYQPQVPHLRPIQTTYEEYRDSIPFLTNEHMTDHHNRFPSDGFYIQTRKVHGVFIEELVPPADEFMSRLLNGESYEDVMGPEDDLSEETILRHLKTRTQISSTIYSIEASSLNEEHELCVVCLAEYEYNEKIATLQCGHEYHLDCIKEWLQIKNTCPVCLSAAVTL